MRETRMQTNNVNRNMYNQQRKPTISIDNKINSPHPQWTSKISINHINQHRTSTTKENAKTTRIHINSKYQRAAKTLPRGPKSPQEQPKTPSRRPKSPPRPSQEGPRVPKSGPKSPQDGPRTPQEPSWDGLGAILGPSKRKIEIQTVRGKSVETFLVDFGAPNAPPNDPKTTPKRVKNQDEKCITFLSLLDSS